VKVIAEGLISIRPHHARRIIAGAKPVEFRRVRTRMVPGSWIAIYESHPVRAITALVQIGDVTFGQPDDLLVLEPDAS
jgi:predicted transcriptional regulator